jgi:hypothetical protein
MKNIHAIAVVLLSVSTAFGQIADSISMQQNRTHESYYSMANGEAANVDNTDWDIAFQLTGFGGSSIRANGHTGVMVYVYPNGTDFTTVDTTGMSWDALYNSEEEWYTGAFDQDADPQDPFDLGWGEYSMITHTINGNRIFILELPSGDYKKLMIESLASGVYSFRHANLDGSSEVVASVDKSNFTDKNFAYYSISNDQVVDREPANNSWDIVFTKYVAEVAPGMSYGVTGVLSNDGVHVRQADGVDPAMADYNNFQVDSVIDVIGYDWKSFSMGVYEITPDLSYFVEDLDGDLWHLVFTRFDLSSSGKTVFAKEQVGSANVEDVEDIKAFGIYPNPAQDVTTIMFDTESETKLTIIDMQGSIVYEESLQPNGFITHKLALTNFQSGVYFVHLSTEKGSSAQKMFVQ